jgi:glutamate/aspartate transport system substrate-binding protein
MPPWQRQRHCPPDEITIVSCAGAARASFAKEVVMKSRSVLCLALLVIALPALAQEGGTLKKLRDTGEIVLGVRDASIPFSYADDSGQSIGYSVDLCMRVVDHLRQTLKMPALKVREQLVTSANRVPLLVNGTVDLECGSTVNNIERQKTVAFSLTTFIVNTKFIVKAASGIQKMTDLKGKTVAVTGGTNTMQKITALSKQMNLDLSVINGKDHAESFLLLTTDRVAAFSEDDILLAGLAATSQTPNGFRLISIDGMLADPYALMMRRDDPQFKAAVDAALRSLFASGEILRIYDKWFVRPIPPRNVVLNFPMGDQLKRVIAKPTDSGDPQDYR